MANSAPALLQLAFVKKGSASGILVELLKTAGGRFNPGAPKINIPKPVKTYPNPDAPGMGSTIAKAAIPAAIGAGATGAGAAAATGHFHPMKAISAVAKGAVNTMKDGANALAGTSTPAPDPTMGDKAKDLGSDAWNKTKEVGADAWGKAKELGSNAADWMGETIKGFRQPMNQWGGAQWGSAGAVGLLTILLAHHLMSGGDNKREE